jgi:DDE family transposase
LTVDGTLLEAWAGQKSSRRADSDHQSQPPVLEGANPTVNFHGEKRSNQTHCSATDPDAMLAPKARVRVRVGLSRSFADGESYGLVVSTLTTRAYGSAERHAALLMAEGLPGTHRVTLGADKGYDAHDFTAELRQMDVTPHLAQNHTNRRSATDHRTTRHSGYQVSQKKRKRIEKVFGWMKCVGLLRKLRHRGLEGVG